MPNTYKNLKKIGCNVYGRIAEQPFGVLKEPIGLLKVKRKSEEPNKNSFLTNFFCWKRIHIFSNLSFETIHAESKQKQIFIVFIFLKSL